MQSLFSSFLILTVAAKVIVFTTDSMEYFVPGVICSMKSVYIDAFSCTVEGWFNDFDTNHLVIICQRLQVVVDWGGEVYN